MLLVEDHGDTAETMAAVLELAGYEVATAGDVATALDLLDRQQFDLLLSDLGLPGRSGLDLMRELRARGDALPGIALSGYGMESDIEQSRAVGFLAHLVKPVEPSAAARGRAKSHAEGHCHLTQSPCRPGPRTSGDLFERQEPLAATRFTSHPPSALPSARAVESVAASTRLWPALGSTCTS